MAYTQPSPYSDGTELKTADIQANEESLKVWVNQEIKTADIDGLSLDRSDIALGRFYPIERSYTFETGEVMGIAQDGSYLNRSYQTSTTKNNDQTSMVQWQDVANSGVRLHCKQDGSRAIVTYYLMYTVEDNEAPASSEGPGHGLWQNRIILTYTNMETGEKYYLTNLTENYGFEGRGSTADTKDPWGGGVLANQRSIMVTTTFAMNKGTYNLTLSVDPHNETAYTTVKSMTAELFYV